MATLKIIISSISVYGTTRLFFDFMIAIGTRVDEVDGGQLGGFLVGIVDQAVGHWLG